MNNQITNDKADSVQNVSNTVTLSLESSLLQMGLPTLFDLIFKPFLIWKKIISAPK